MPGLYPQKRNTSLVEAYLELTGIKDNCYCHNSGFLVPCPCHKQPCPPRHENRALWTYINFVFWMLLNNPMLNSCQIYHVDREGLSSKMELSGWQHPRSWLTRTCLPLKTLLKALTLGNVNLTHPQALQCPFKEKIFQGKRSYPLLFWWKMNGGVPWHFHLCGNRDTTRVEYKMESVLKSQKKNLGSQNILEKEQIWNDFLPLWKENNSQLWNTPSPQGRAVPDAFQLTCPCVSSFSTHGAWMFHLQSLHRENIPLSQVCKCQWRVQIHVSHIQIQNYKFCRT